MWMSAASPTCVARTQTVGRPTMWPDASACPASLVNPLLVALNCSFALWRSSVQLECSAALASAHLRVSLQGIAWITNSATVEAASANAQTTASALLFTAASQAVFAYLNHVVPMTRNVDKKTPVLDAKMDCLNARTSARVRSSVAEMQSVQPGATRPSVPALKVSLVMPTTRRLAARRNSVSSTATVSAKASAKTSSVPSLLSQVSLTAAVDIIFFSFDWVGTCIIQSKGMWAKTVQLEISYAEPTQTFV